MKKNTLHKVMATALVGAMAMSTLTGCGSSADNTTADAGTKESVAESSAASTDAGASTAVAGIDGWEAFADNVTLQIPVYDRGSSGNGCSDVENWCHRTVFAEWWAEQTGELIEELYDPSEPKVKKPAAKKENKEPVKKAVEARKEEPGYEQLSLFGLAGI